MSQMDARCLPDARDHFRGDAIGIRSHRHVRITDPVLGGARAIGLPRGTRRKRAITRQHLANNMTPTRQLREQVCQHLANIVGTMLATCWRTRQHAGELLANSANDVGEIANNLPTCWRAVGELADMAGEMLANLPTLLASCWHIAGEALA